MREIVLCADEETVLNPGILGLEGESLAAQDWLHVATEAQGVRDYLRHASGVEEVWVASSNDVDPINLAAALKRDSAGIPVRLVAGQESGSLKSRAAAAGIDEVLGYREMAMRYADIKRRERDRESRRRLPYAEAMRLRPRVPQVGKRQNAQDTGKLPAVKAARTEAAPDSQVTLSTRPVAPVGTGKRGYVLTVVSASGGTGKSTVAALSALIAARNGYRTALLDADLQFGDLALVMGEQHPLTVDKALADPQLAARIQPLPERPVLVAAPERLEQSEVFLPELPLLVEQLRTSFDVVIVNTGSFWTEGHIRLLEVSTNALFLMDQRPASIQAGKRALDLCSRCGLASHPFLFAVNRCGRNALLSSIDISCALNGAKVSELKEGGREITEMMGAGMAVRLVETRNDLCQSLSDFLQGVIPAGVGDAVVSDAVPKAPSKRGPFRKGRKGKAACL